MRINLNRFLEKASHYLFALVIILDCRSIWTVTKGLDWFNYFNVVLLAVSILGCMLYGKVRERIFKKSLVIAALISMYLIIFWVLDAYRNMNFIRQILILMACIFYLLLFGRRENKSIISGENAVPFWNCYKNIMILIACVSLLFWMFGSNLGYIKPTGYIWSTWSTAKDTYVSSYYGVYFETQSWKSLFSIVKFRNTAIFTEAPMASLHFSIAYLIEFFIKDKSKIRNLIILTIAIVSTFSTTGYVIVILALFAKLFLKKENKTFCWIIKNSIVLIVLIGAVCAIQYLITQRLGTFSGSVRLDDFRAGFMAWMNHPLMGNGYGNYDAIKHYMSSFRSHNTGFSNSPMYVLALGGVYLFVLYLIMIIKGLYKMIICKDWNSMSFYVLLLTLFTITLIPFNGLTYIMLISMATYIKQQKRFLKYDISQRKLPNNLEA